LVATDTKPHREIHFSLGNRLLPHVAMTVGAVDSRADMRCVIEFHVRGRLKIIDALPWNVLAPRSVRGKLLNLRLARSNHLMAGHAEIDVRDSGIGTLVHTNVAVGALHAVAEMHLMRESDWLNRLRAKVQEFPNGSGNSRMRRGKNVRT
jgi:hypothetical protein